MTSILTRYHDALESGQLQPDAAQAAALNVLDRMAAQWAKRARKKRSPVKKFVKRLIGAKKPPIKGVYLYGSVGRGKTMMMDWVIPALSDSGVRVERWHFHAFMLKLHQDLKDQKAHSPDLDNRIRTLADQWAARVQVLCFDEFHVTDVADAMIMAPLFTRLFESGVTVIATSNWQPDDLYSGGLQRQRFLPFIDTLKNAMHIVHIDNAIDYRQLKRQEYAAWLAPLNDATAETFDILFRDAAGYDPIETHEVHIGSRTLVLPRASKTTAILDMAQLLDQPLGAADFIAVAQRYELIFLNNLHQFTQDTSDKAKRFMVMIDVFYDHNIMLVVRAETAAEKLYPAKARLAFEFDRTLSRLTEMTPSRAAA